MPFSDFRKEFPITLQKKYLNHAVISPFSTRVTDALDEYINERSFGVIDAYINGEDVEEETKNLIGYFINANPERIAFTSNISEGFNILVNNLNWNAGDEVVLAGCEFTASVFPVLTLKKRGVKIIWIKNRGGQILVENVETLINKRTKLLALNFVEPSNGYQNDLERMGKLCRENDVVFAVDGTQGVGAVPIDVKKYHVDFLVNEAHKWLMGAVGVAFVYVGKRLLHQFKMDSAGRYATENTTQCLETAKTPQKLERSAVNYMGIAALNSSLKLLLEANPHKIYPYLLKLGRKMIQPFKALGLNFTGSEDDKWKSGIFLFKGNGVAELFNCLNAHNIICSVNEGKLSVSPHFYNSEDEIECLVDTVKKKI
jgi:selenocysteine lyase/cysteine desulfurase